MYKIIVGEYEWELSYNQVTSMLNAVKATTEDEQNIATRLRMLSYCEQFGEGYEEVKGKLFTEYQEYTDQTEKPVDLYTFIKLKLKRWELKG